MLYTQAVQYAMLCTAPDVCLATYLTRGYKGDQGVDHQIAVKIVLGVNKDIFLSYGGDEQLIVKNYVDASFGIDLDDSKSRSGYILKVGAISQSSSMQSIVDIENL